MRRSIYICLTAALICNAATGPLAAKETDVTTQLPDDPYIWLEDTYGEKSMAWVEAENAVTVDRLEADARYEQAFEDAFEIVSAQDRLAMPGFRNGEIYNFWSDAEHLRGIWRRTTLESYRTEKPDWETILDIGALGEAEGRSWVYKGVECLWPEQRLCLVSLSDGGEDAVEVREFDLAAKSFVEGGFFVPKGKSSATWLDKDHLLVATDFAGDGSDLTESGYPVVVKRLTRGAPLGDAEEIFRGAKTDVAASPFVLHDRTGNTLAGVVRAPDFYRRETWVMTPRGLEQMVLPEKVDISALIENRLVMHLTEDWTVGEETFPAGALVSLDRDAVVADPANLAPRLIWKAGPSEAFESVGATKNRLLVATLDNVRGRIWSFAPAADGGWTKLPIDLPDNLALNLVSADEASNRFFLAASGFTTPTTLILADAETGATEVVRTQPAKFDATSLVVDQRWATSTDGTRIPYFLVHRKDAPTDGSMPTILDAYGGFQVSQTPYYSALIGKLWLEKGGAFALANIRGGGEFGPAWHEAGLGTKRQIVYDDFAAVGEDLIASGKTSPEHLGIMGGSNGGLLMGVEMIQRPDLWNAVTIQVPLLDMIRISEIAAGASWQGEYGNVNADPDVMAFWLDHSPYHMLRQGADYPEPYIFTTTRDDRTGPAHARKFAARMKEFGLPYYYYENTEGGHGAGADLKQTARTWALTYTYFMHKLMPE